MMTLWRAAEGRAETIEFGMRAPAGLRLEDYPLHRGQTAGDLFPWTRVKEDRNVFGATSVAVPGTVAGMDLAHRKYGRKTWAALLAPAVQLAEAGMLIDWYASLMIASATRQLAQDRDAASLFLVDGQWPNIAGWTALSDARLNQSTHATTLQRLADGGAAEFYHGEIARRAGRGCTGQRRIAGLGRPRKLSRGRLSTAHDPLSRRHHPRTLGAVCWRGTGTCAEADGTRVQPRRCPVGTKLCNHGRCARRGLSRPARTRRGYWRNPGRPRPAPRPSASSTETATW